MDNVRRLFLNDLSSYLSAITALYDTCGLLKYTFFFIVSTTHHYCLTIVIYATVI